MASSAAGRIPSDLAAWTRAGTAFSAAGPMLPRAFADHWRTLASRSFRQRMRAGTASFAGAIGKRFVYVPMPVAIAKALFTPKPVQGFFGLPREALDYFDDAVWHDATQATRELAGLGIECPSLADYVPQLVAFYRRHRETVRRSAMI